MCGFESHLRQLVFLWKKSFLECRIVRCIKLCCFVVVSINLKLAQLVSVVVVSINLKLAQLVSVVVVSINLKLAQLVSVVVVSSL